MALFQPDVVEFGDLAGIGMWLNAHWYEHQQFITLALQRTPPVELVTYDILYLADNTESLKSWQDTHWEMHESLRAMTGVDGYDYQDFDLGVEDDWYSFLDFHRQEHAQLRQAFGVF